VLTILDLKAEFAKLKMLRGPIPETPESERGGSLREIGAVPRQRINVAKCSGEGPVGAPPERRRDRADRRRRVDLSHLTVDGPRSHALKAGMVVIVPQGGRGTASKRRMA
jgi:hypothetical protein